MNASPSCEPSVNPLKARLAEGPVLGLWSIIPSPTLAEVFSRAGFDFLILDMEHGNYDLQTLENSIRACEIAGASPLVRVPGPNPFAVQWALDLGAHGIVVPQVRDALHAREALAQIKFPPEGVRGFNPFTRAANYTPPPTIPSGKLSNAFPLTSIIIESLGAMRDLDAILAMPGLDMIYLGVYDLSVALECAGNTRHPRILEFVDTAIRKANQAGKTVSLMVRNDEEIDQALAAGVKMLVFAVDTFLIHQTASHIAASFQQRRRSMK